MLVLTRKQGEVLIINDHIKIKIVRINGNQVSVGIEAPTSVSVRREELHDVASIARKSRVRPIEIKG